MLASFVMFNLKNQIIMLILKIKLNSLNRYFITYMLINQNNQLQRRMITIKSAKRTKKILNLHFKLLQYPNSG